VATLIQSLTKKRGPVEGFLLNKSLFHKLTKIPTPRRCPDNWPEIALLRKESSGWLGFSLIPVKFVFLDVTFRHLKLIVVAEDSPHQLIVVFLEVSCLYALV
jgi:hypothetical protein